MEQDKEKEILEAQVRRIVTNLFKNFLTTTEDLRQEHLSCIAKVQGQFPKEFIDNLNYLDLPRYSRLRKRILDSGNDALREIHTILEDFSIKIK
jgi:hypothetical protein